MQKYISLLFLILLFVCCINAKEYSLSSSLIPPKRNVGKIFVLRSDNDCAGTELAPARRLQRSGGPGGDGAHQLRGAPLSGGDHLVPAGAPARPGEAGGLHHGLAQHVRLPGGHGGQRELHQSPQLHGLREDLGVRWYRPGKRDNTKQKFSYFLPT